MKPASVNGRIIIADKVVQSILLEVSRPKLSSLDCVFMFWSFFIFEFPQ